MRRRIGTCLLAVLMLAALTVSAMAAGIDESSLKVAAPAKCTVEIADAEKGILKVKVVSYKSGENYLVRVQNTEGLPVKTETGDSVLNYINQNQDGDFTKEPTVDKDHPYVFPNYEDNPSSDDTYYVYVTSGDTNFTQNTPVATFKYEAAASYKLGDVDGKDGITPSDALLALQIAGELKKTDGTAFTAQEKKAADVDGVAGVEPSDALLILQRAGEIIKKFPVE